MGVTLPSPTYSRDGLQHLLHHTRKGYSVQETKTSGPILVRGRDRHTRNLFLGILRLHQMNHWKVEEGVNTFRTHCAFYPTWEEYWNRVVCFLVPTKQTAWPPLSSCEPWWGRASCSAPRWRAFLWCRNPLRGEATQLQRPKCRKGGWLKRSRTKLVSTLWCLHHSNRQKPYMFPWRNWDSQPVANPAPSSPGSHDSRQFY